MTTQTIATNNLRRGRAHVGTSVAHNSRCEHSNVHIEMGICWHGPCVVTLVFRDGFWVVNKQGSGRRFRRDELSQLATKLVEAAEGLLQVAKEIVMNLNGIDPGITKALKVAITRYEEAAK